MNSLRVFSVSFTTATLGVALALGQSGASAGSLQSASNAATKLDAVSATLILKTSLTSKNAPSGKPVKAVLKKALTLPNGEVLPKETPFLGTVVASNKHSKEKPNGTLILEFHEAVLKGHDPVQLIVRLKALAASSESENATTTLPNSNGNMVSLAGNSGGGAQVTSQLNDRSSLKGKYSDASSIDGVHLIASSQGDGAIFALGEDVYLDADVQITVLVALAPTKAP